MFGLKKYFSLSREDDSRTNLIKKNVIHLAIIRIASILISLLIVPLTIDYISSEYYGVWLTINSIVIWVQIFNVGINNGLRNELAKSFAEGNSYKAKELISTAYSYLALIFIPIMLLLLYFSGVSDWEGILNTSVSRDVVLSIKVVIIYFCLRFILGTIDVILLADQRPAESAFRVLIEQALSIIVLFILTKVTSGSLFLMSIALCIIPLLILTIFNVYLLRTRYKQISPAFKSVRTKAAKSILSLGIKFFVIQIAGIILFQSSNFIIIRNFGSIEVTNYNIAYKYFSILTLSMSIFLVPLWSAVTNAHALQDYYWIRRAVNKCLKISILFAGIGLLMLLLSSKVYLLWIGDSVTIPFTLSILIYIYILISLFGGVYCNVLNGIGRLKGQFISSIISPIIFIASAYILIHIFELGVISLVISLILSNFNAYIVAPIEYYHYMRSLKLKS